MVAWLTSMHSCISCVEWDGSCEFDLQSGGQLLAHNFVLTAHITSLQQKWENNERNGNTFHLYFQWQCVTVVMAHAHYPTRTLSQYCGGTCILSNMHTLPVLWWHMHITQHAHSPSIVMTHAGNQHVQCHNYVMAHTCGLPHLVYQYSDDTCRWPACAESQLCDGTSTLSATLGVPILWWHMQVTSMCSVTSLIEHACDTAGLLSHFLEQLPLYITFKSGCYHIGLEELQPTDPHNRDQTSDAKLNPVCHLLALLGA